MPKIKKSIIIDCPIEAVWETLSCFDQISLWAENVSHSCFLTEQREGVGTIRRIQQKSTVLTERIIIWNDFSSLGYELSGLPPIFSKVTNTWFLSSGENGVEVSLEVEIVPKRRPAVPFAAVACIVIGRVNNRMILGLKDYLENAEPIRKLREEISALTSRLIQLENSRDSL